MSNDENILIIVGLFWFLIIFIPPIIILLQKRIYKKTGEIVPLSHKIITIILGPLWFIPWIMYFVKTRVAKDSIDPITQKILDLINNSKYTDDIVIFSIEKYNETLLGANIKLSQFDYLQNCSRINEALLNRRSHLHERMQKYLLNEYTAN